MVAELGQAREMLTHIRSNTMATSKDVKNCAWQLSELRSGATDRNGAVTSQAGSLLYLLSEDTKTSCQATLEVLGKSVTAIQEAIEKGVNPEKSLKRKFEAQEAEEKEEQERAKLAQLQQEKREKIYHPISGQAMFLTEGERRELYRSLHLMKEGDTPMAGMPASSAPPGTPAVGSFQHGFPPASTSWLWTTNDAHGTTNCACGTSIYACGTNIYASGTINFASDWSYPWDWKVDLCEE